MKQPSWKLRRRAVFGSLIFSMLMLVYIAVRWEDSGLGETLALGAYGLMGVVVAAYIGGAAYQDVKIYPKLMSLEDKENGIEEDIDDIIDNDQYREEENNV